MSKLYFILLFSFLEEIDRSCNDRKLCTVDGCNRLLLNKLLALLGGGVMN